MVRFRRRFFPPRRYPLPIRWIMLALAVGLAVFVAYVVRKVL